MNQAADGMTVAHALDFAGPRDDGFRAHQSANFHIPVLLFLLCLAAQLYLLFAKSFNWDEFLHFRQVYELKAGTLFQPFQVIHLRMLGWATEISNDLLDQMLAARMFVWATHLLTLGMIYGLARQFTGRVNAFYAAFAYLSAGSVFLHAFSIRADAMVAATLMSAMFLLARPRLTMAKAIVIGGLAGLAMMMTVKALFYAPCFVGLAWLKLREAPDRARFLLQMLAIAASAAGSFIALYLVHTWGFPRTTGAPPNVSFFAFFLRWVTIDMQYAAYTEQAIVLAPLFFAAAIFAPLAWIAAGLKPDARLALAGFIAPLAVLFFYRNTFPYFFVFLLAPVAVAIAPALGWVRERYGGAFLSVLLAVVPIGLAATEPREVIGRQRALIDYVHREFPHRPGYLDYSGMIADYPRILTHLTSGNGMRLYREHGEARIAREIDRGNVPFIIANHPLIQAALEGRPAPASFLPADVGAMYENYVPQWGVLWREGKRLPAGRDDLVFDVRRGGNFVLAGDALTIDGMNLPPGGRIFLSAGRHRVDGERRRESILWRGNRLPSPPPNISVEKVFTNF